MDTEIGSVNNNELWRYPNLKEVIVDLSNPDDDIKMNAAAYLQHLSFQNDPVKVSVRDLHGIKPLIEMLCSPNAEVVKSALGALRNLSCGRANDKNKIEILKQKGVDVIINLLKTTNNSSITSLSSGLLWNLSSCQYLKDEILHKSLDVLFSYIIMPLICCISNQVTNPVHKLQFTNFRHATGVLRNVSSVSRKSRPHLHQLISVVSSILTFVSWSSKHKEQTDDKSLENCVIILRNLSLNLNKERSFIQWSSSLSTTSSSSSSSSSLCRRSFSLGRKSTEPVYVVKKESLESPTVICFRSRMISRLARRTFKQSSTDECLSSLNNTKPNTDKVDDAFVLLTSSELLLLLLYLLSLYNPVVPNNNYNNKNSSSNNNHGIENRGRRHDEDVNVNICEAILETIPNLVDNSDFSLESKNLITRDNNLQLFITNLMSHSDRIVLATSNLLKQLTFDPNTQNSFGKRLLDFLLNKIPASSSPSSSSSSSLYHLFEPYTPELITLIESTLRHCIGPGIPLTRSVIKCGWLKSLQMVALSPLMFGIRRSSLASILLKMFWSLDELHTDFKNCGYKKCDFFIEPKMYANPNGVGTPSNYSECSLRLKKVRFSDHPDQTNEDKINETQLSEQQLQQQSLTNLTTTSKTHNQACHNEQQQQQSHQLKHQKQQQHQQQNNIQFLSGSITTSSHHHPVMASKITPSSFSSTVLPPPSSSSLAASLLSSQSLSSSAANTTTFFMNSLSSSTKTSTFLTPVTRNNFKVENFIGINLTLKTQPSSSSPSLVPSSSLYMAASSCPNSFSLGAMNISSNTSSSSSSATLLSIPFSRLTLDANNLSSSLSSSPVSSSSSLQPSNLILLKSTSTSSSSSSSPSLFAISSSDKIRKLKNFPPTNSWV